MYPDARPVTAASVSTMQPFGRLASHPRGVAPGRLRPVESAAAAVVSSDSDDDTQQRQPLVATAAIAMRPPLRSTIYQGARNEGMNVMIGSFQCFLRSREIQTDVV